MLTGPVNLIIRRMRKLSLEMEESQYPNQDEEEMQEYREFAFPCLEEMIRYMKDNYREDRVNVKSLMKDIYCLAATGEYSKYQEAADLAYADRCFHRIQGGLGLAIMQYCAQIVYYYYRVYNKDRDNERTEKQISEYFSLTMQLETTGEYRTKRESTEEVKDARNSAASVMDRKRFLIDMKAHLDRYVVGQETLKKKLCVMMYQWKFDGVRSNLLMIGPSGSGKNYMIDNLKSFQGLGLPLYSFDCSGLSPAGFKGGDVGDIIDGLTKICNGEVEKAIVYLDEIDKIINPNFDSHGTNVNALCQQQLLSMVQGTSEVRGVDTSKILFVLGGAFPALSKLREEKCRNVRNTIGFGSKTVEETVREDLRATLRTEISEIGGEVEFLGRIEDIICMEPLNRTELKRVLLDHEIGAVAKVMEACANSGITLRIEPEMIERILDIAEQDTAGARAVKNTVNMILGKEYLYDCLVGGYDVLTIHTGMLLGEMPKMSRKGDDILERCS